MRRRTLDITCKRCGKKIFEYIKFGDGNLINCYKKRIVEDNSKNKNHEVMCTCGNVVGRDLSTRIKIDQTSVKINK